MRLSNKLFITNIINDTREITIIRSLQLIVIKKYACINKPKLEYKK